MPKNQFSEILGGMDFEEFKDVAYFAGPLLTAIGVVVSTIAFVSTVRPYMQAYLLPGTTPTYAFLIVENYGKRPAKNVTFEFSDGLDPEGSNQETPRFVRRQLNRKFLMWPPGYFVRNIYAISEKGTEHDPGRHGPKSDVTLTIRYRGAFYFNRRKEVFDLNMEVVHGQTWVSRRNSDAEVAPMSR